MSINELQKEVALFCQQAGLQSSALHCFLDTTSELGEVAKELLHITSYGQKPLHKTKELELELGDALFSFLCLANSLDINLHTALQMALTKYEKRLLAKGSLSSN